MADEKKTKTEISDGLDMDSLETLPEDQDGKKPEPDGKKKKKKNAPAGKNVIKGKAPMFSDADKSKAMGIAATIICVAGLVFFVGWQAITGIRSNTAPPGDLPDTGQSTTAPDSQPGNPDTNPEFDTEHSTQGTNWTSAFDRSPWGYKLADDDGEPAADNENGIASGGTRYWVKARNGDREFKIVIPAGYVAADMGDHIEVMTENAVPVDGDEPMEFWWRYSSEIESVLQFGGYDTLVKTGTTGYDRWDVIADSYYMFKDESGREYPVVTATLTQIESGESPVPPYYEYWLIVGRQSGDGKYLVGKITASSFSSMSSQRCPDMEHLAKALFPMSSQPDPPAAWNQPLDYVQQSGGQDTGNQASGTEDYP